MTKKEQQRKTADARRSAGREYGFRQNSYTNFKDKDGYFFCLNFSIDEATLTVKPIYADDLWWEIWDSPEYKKEPVSYRGIGEYSLAGMLLATYEISEPTDDIELSNMFSRVFRDASERISAFLADNPDADTFYPDESKMENDPDRLLYMITLIHNGRDKEVLDIITQERHSGHRCAFRRGWFRDSYTYISRWCNRERVFRRILKWTDIRYCRFMKVLCYLCMGNSYSFGFKGSPINDSINLISMGLTVIPSFTAIVLFDWCIFAFVWIVISFAVSLSLYFDRRADRFYDEFGKLPKKEQRKWAFISWAFIAGFLLYFGAIIELNRFLRDS